MKTPLPAVVTVVMVLLAPLGAASQERLLGSLDFPNSGAEEAQADFIEGVLFLHNFEYEDAARAFRRAGRTDPGFALAFWGEAQTHNHPVWMQQDREAAMAVLNELGPTPEARQAKAPTEREKRYLQTLEVLYGNTPDSKGKSKEERDLLYEAAMKRLHDSYPDDHEATVFYGLSILGTAHEGRDFATYMRAAAVLFDVWNQNNRHPGAAHYLIHSFDDPVHAPLGLPMAEAYSEIAPAAAHAQHMTSHIFLALGMWDDVISANIVARDVQTARQQELGEQTTVCGHYPWWLQYGYLQNGEDVQAEQVLNTCFDRVRQSPTNGERWHFAIMKAHQVVDTENWERVDEWTIPFEPDTYGSRNYLFASAFAALHSGNGDRARRILRQLMQAPGDIEKDIQVRQVQSLVLLDESHTTEGLAMLREAVADEAGLPIDFGPPTIVKPSQELLGDVLLELGRFDEAATAYEKQLERTPDRRRTLLGLERAQKRETR